MSDVEKVLLEITRAKKSKARLVFWWFAWRRAI
jgi:hypothetical protein